MSNIKKKLQAEISDDLFSEMRIPAVSAAVDLIKKDHKRKINLLKSYPGILLLGDWYDQEINLDFFNSVKQKLIQNNCNAFTLDDIRTELKRTKKPIDAIEIRKRGLDNAAIVLLVDGNGRGTVAETTEICNKQQWNNKCLVFVAEKDLGAGEHKSYLKRFKTPLIYYRDVNDLEKLLIRHSLDALERWLVQVINHDK